MRQRGRDDFALPLTVADTDVGFNAQCNRAALEDIFFVKLKLQKSESAGGPSLLGMRESAVSLKHHLDYLHGT